MKRTALLRTRCGCQQYMEVEEWYERQRYIKMPIRPNLCALDKDSLEVIMPYKTRLFELDGITRDGIVIYTEVYE